MRENACIFSTGFAVLLSYCSTHQIVQMRRNHRMIKLINGLGTTIIIIVSSLDMHIPITNIYKTQSMIDEQLYNSYINPATRLVPFFTQNVVKVPFSNGHNFCSKQI